MLRSTCGLIRRVSDYQTAVISFQLVLKLAEILDANVSVLSWRAAARLPGENTTSLRSFVLFRLLQKSPGP